MLLLVFPRNLDDSKLFALSESPVKQTTPQTKHTMSASNDATTSTAQRVIRSLVKSLALFCLLVLSGLPAFAQVADLAVSKIGLPQPVGAFSNLTYTVTVTNAGPNDATAVVLTDTLPPETAYVSDSSGCVVASGVV